MMVLPALADVLVAAGLGTKGTDIFLGMLPESPDDAMVLREYEGTGPERVYADRASTIEYPRVQVMVRGTSYEEARERIERAVIALEEVADLEAGGARYLAVFALGSPAYLDHDENGRVLLVANFEVQKGRG